MRVATLLKIAAPLCAVVATGMVIAYLYVGKTLGELLDYADIRLQGHPKLELVSVPLFKIIRDVTNQPALSDRLQVPFRIPAPAPVVVTNPEATLSNDLNVLRVGSQQPYKTIADAARAAKDGQIVEIQAGTYISDVALWHQKVLTIRAVGGRARIYANGAAAEGKAIWVFRNGDFTVENIEFFDAKVGDHNGAGIRAEAGSLVVNNCLFYGNQNGILTTGELSLVDIKNSEFAYNGHGDGLSHAIYIGLVKELRVFGSYFHHANRGHLIKSRAEKSVIAYNRITDESAGRASYEIDLPNGGDAFVGFNVVQQSATGENSALISFGAEGLRWSKNRLWLEKNTLVNDNPWGGTFLRVAKGTNQVVAVNNLLLGNGGIQNQADISIMDNMDAQWDWFVMPQRFNYHLKANIPPSTKKYQRPDGSPSAGYFLEHSMYHLDPKAEEFAGALPPVPGGVH